MKSMTKYLFEEDIKTLGMFYLFYTLTQAIMTLLLLSYQNETSQIASLSVSTSIFLFVLFLNSLKKPMRFGAANGISRRTYFLSNLLALSWISAIASAVEVLLSQLFGLMHWENSTFYLNFYSQRYQSYVGSPLGIWESFLWTFIYYALWSALGFMITAVYYRSNRTVKIVVSVAPVLVIISLLSYVPTFTYSTQLQSALFYRVCTALSRFLLLAFENPYIAMLGLLSVELALVFFSYLLVRRAPIKE